LNAHQHRPGGKEATNGVKARFRRPPDRQCEKLLRLRLTDLRRKAREAGATTKIKTIHNSSEFSPPRVLPGRGGIFV